MTTDNNKQRIQEARDHLERASKMPTMVDQTREYKKGFLLLKEVASGSVSDKEAQIIANLRKTYTRALISSLPVTDGKEDAYWVQLLHLISFELKNEQEELTATDPKLKQRYDDFESLYHDELIRAMKRWATQNNLKL